MTNREYVNEYKRVMGGIVMPAGLEDRIIEKSVKTAAGSNSRYFQAVLAVSGIAAVATGIGVIALFNKKFGD